MTFQPIEKRSVLIDGHKTSISVERCFWDEIKRMAAERGLLIGKFVGGVADQDPDNLSSALRQTVLADLVARAGLTPSVGE